jgi:two-component system CheB/CheR fusion protein
MHRSTASATILEHEVSELRLLIERRAGVLLQTPNENLIPVLTSHMEARQFSSATELLESLRQPDCDVEPLLESLVDGSTGFGRHPGAIGAFARIVLPELRQRKASKSSKALRVWSAGCGSGEEAYEIAIAICEGLQEDAGWNIHVVGSDIRQNALQVAERGLYPQSDLLQMPREILQAYFSRVGDHLLVKSRLRNLVAFTSMNLAQPSYLGRYDAIFCMDVLPQFSTAQRIALAQRMQLYLEPGGYLLLGDGEKLPATEINLEVGVANSYTLYRKPMAAGAGA